MAIGAEFAVVGSSWVVANSVASIGASVDTGFDFTVWVGGLAVVDNCIDTAAVGTVGALDACADTISVIFHVIVVVLFEVRLLISSEIVIQIIFFIVIVVLSNRRQKKDYI